VISRRMNRCETILVFALACSVVWAGEPNDTPVQITFEISPTALGPFSASYATEGWRPFASKPAYAAAIPFREPANRFMDLQAALARVTSEKEYLPRMLHQLPDDLALSQRNLESAKQNKPRIPDKVTIYPITWADDAPGN